MNPYRACTATILLPEVTIHLDAYCSIYLIRALYDWVVGTWSGRTWLKTRMAPVKGHPPVRRQRPRNEPYNAVPIRSFMHMYSYFIIYSCFLQPNAETGAKIFKTKCESQVCPPHTARQPN